MTGATSHSRMTEAADGRLGLLRSDAAAVLVLRGVRHGYAAAPVTPDQRAAAAPVMTPVLDSIDLELAPGERCAIMGPSGSGKSTLLHIAAGLERPLAGEVRWAGQSINDLHEPGRTRLRRRFTGVVFQDFHLLAALSALENVELALALTRPEWTGQQRRSRARALLDQMGLAERQQRAAPETLSGGERQRVAVARALAHGPRLVLADEPTGRLDHANGERVIECLSAGVAEAGAALLLVTHDRDVAAGLLQPVVTGAAPGRCLYLRDGHWADPLTADPPTDAERGDVAAHDRASLPRAGRGAGQGRVG